MNRKCLVLILSAFVLVAKSQVSEMNWKLDYQIYLKLANDSNYTYDIKNVFHVTNSKQEFSTDYIFYPVNPGLEYSANLPKDTLIHSNQKTLWSSLNAYLGGGWIHFTNCIAYALETQKLNLQAPLMIRPDSDWKPNPMTDSYKRTKNWTYYIPYEQKNAQKEYNRRLSSGTTGDLKSLPDSYLTLFMETSQKEYNKLKKEGKNNILAKIDLVKVILGANYLGDAQIKYISSAVFESIMSYSSNNLPSIIVFDEFDAAAVMSLDPDGYKIDKIVYKSSANLTDMEITSRNTEIESIITKINEYNQNSFKKQLGNYYK